MSPLLAALLGVVLAPLFIASWRFSLIGLSCQGMLMAWMVFQTNHESMAVDELITLADLILVRGIGLPIALYAVLHSHKAPNRINFISPNLLSWSFVLGIVLLAFNFAPLLVAGPGEARSVIAVVSAEVMLGLLILTNPSGVFGQMVGVLYIENATALFELRHEGHAQALGVHLGQIGVVVLSFLLYRWYLSTAEMKPETTTPVALEGPTL